MILIILVGVTVQAQFEDNMESYTDGEPISGGYWRHAENPVDFFNEIMSFVF